MVTKDIANALMFLHDQGISLSIFQGSTVIFVPHLIILILSGIAHRDVKPENILCTSPEGVSPVKLCDLDLASKAVSSSPPRLSSVASEPDLASPVGSAEFMAPEVSLSIHLLSHLFSLRWWMPSWESLSSTTNGVTCGLSE